MLKLVQTHSDAVDAANELEAAGAANLDELWHMAAQQMLATALLAERQIYLDAHADRVVATGKRLVVGNGFAREREVVTDAGPITVGAPRVNDKRDGERFSSNILPAYMRRSLKVSEVLPCCICVGCRPGTSHRRWPVPWLRCRTVSIDDLHSPAPYPGHPRSR